MYYFKNILKGKWAENIKLIWSKAVKEFDNTIKKKIKIVSIVKK